MTKNICELIKEELKNQDRSIAWLAKKIHQDHSGLCKKLRTDHITTDLLKKINKALNHDFFSDLSNEDKKDT